MTEDERDVKVAELENELGAIEASLAWVEIQLQETQEQHDDLVRDRDRIEQEISALEDTACEYAEDAS
jgi:hypothetical protein